LKCITDRTWAEIDLDKLEYNYNQFSSIINTKSTKIMAIVKANAYGHGSIDASKLFEALGAGYLGVAALDEALEIRNSGVQTPILILNHASSERNFQIVGNNVTSTIFSTEQALLLNDTAKSLNKTAKVHVKVDTGMTRVGVNFEDAANFVQQLSNYTHLEVEGLFTHFSTASDYSLYDQDNSFVELQFKRYMQVIDTLKSLGIHIPLKHVCNSGAAINYPHMHLDMIRPGISLYGYYNSVEVEECKLDLQQPMTVKSQIIRLNSVESGVHVGYGRTFTTKRKSLLATIPVGYADGFSRTLSGKVSALVNGEFAPIVGTICMDQCVIDVTDMTTDLKIGTEVVVLGCQGDKTILAEDLGNLMGTISHEILCMISRRVPRKYIQKDKPSYLQNYLI